jgi:integrase
VGYLYRPKLKSGALCAVYWMQYFVDGARHRESTGVTSHPEAKRIMQDREGRAARGEPLLRGVDKIRYEEIAADLRSYYQTTGKRDLKEAGHRFTHLDPFFAHTRVAAITPPRITAYVTSRQAAHAANATINRELATLSRMLRLAYTNNKLFRPPVIEKLEEAPPRAGFFEDEQYAAVRRHLAPDLQVAAAIAHTFGWRTQSEVLTRERRHLDLGTGTLRLDPGETKNGEGRVVYLTPELRALLTAQLARLDALQKKLGRIVPFLFPHLSGRRAGTRRIDYRKHWQNACQKAGVPGRLRHDFRRTAVRNLERKAVPRSVAMKITGHLTENVYRRYAIVSDMDLQEATRKLSSPMPALEPRLQHTF